MSLIKEKQQRKMLTEHVVYCKIHVFLFLFVIGSFFFISEVNCAKKQNTCSILKYSDTKDTNSIQVILSLS